MAFNPFHTMRKNSKAVLAVVTIFIMFIFVLGSGIQGGDFFQDILPRWFGSAGTKGPVLATAFGDKLREQELQSLRSQRTLANTFMLMAVERANANQIREVEAHIQAKRVSPEVAGEIQQFVRMKLLAVDPPKEYSDAEKNRAFNTYVQTVQQLFSPFFGGQGLQRLQGLLNRTDKAKEDDHNAIVAVMNVLTYDALRMQQRRGELYFQTVANGSIRDAMIFKVLLLKADQMGVNYPGDLVNQLILRETNNHLRQSDSAQIERALRQGRSYTFDTDMLLKAIGDEFKVRTVLTALEGRGQANAFPGYLTPYEFYQFYKDNLSEVTFDVIKVPVQDFVARVTEEPGIDDLRKLFNQYKTREQDPASETPGFKESKKIKLAWISANSSLPAYAKALPIVAATSQVAAGFVPTALGASGVPAVMHVAQPQLAEALPLWAKYRQKVKDQTESGAWGQWFSFGVQDSSLYRALPVTAYLAQFAGPLHTVKDISAALALTHQAYALETRDRVKVGIPLVLAPLAHTPAFPLAALGPAVAALPPAVPMDAYAAQFRDEARAERLGHFFLNDMKAFQKKLADIRTGKGADGKDKKPEEIKAEVDRYVAEFAKARGLQQGASQEARDKFTLSDDPGLKPLRDKSPPKPNDPFDDWQFTFFREQQNVPGFGPMPAPQKPLFEAEWFPGFEPSPQSSKEGSHFLVWKTEEVQPKGYVKYDEAPPEVQAKVKAAWKFEKARELARAEAERLAEKAREVAKKQLQEANNVNGFKGELFDLAQASKFSTFELPEPGQGGFGKKGMSVLEFQQGFRPDQPGQYSPYQMRPSENVPYPGEIPGKLLDVRNKPLGETVVVADAPKGTFYVASLVRKDEKRVEDFSLLYGRTNRERPTDRDPLYVQFAKNRAVDEARRDVIERLKAEAKYTENAEELKRFDKERGDE